MGKKKYILLVLIILIIGVLVFVRYRQNRIKYIPVSEIINKTAMKNNNYAVLYYGELTNDIKNNLKLFNKTYRTDTYVLTNDANCKINECLKNDLNIEVSGDRFYLFFEGNEFLGAIDENIPTDRYDDYIKKYLYGNLIQEDIEYKTATAEQYIKLVNSKKLTALLGLSNFLINHVNGIVVKKIQSIAKKKYDVDLSKEQIQRVLQIVCIVRGMMKTLELNMDGSGLTVSEYNEDDEKFELPDNLNIVVLAGGLSNLRNMSINTGYMVKNALKEKGHNVILLDSYMGYDEEEIIIDDPFNDTDKYSLEVNSISEEPVDLWAVRKRRTDQSSSFFGPNVIQICKKADIVFIALHSSSGETGKVQATFDLLDIDYTGCDYFSGAICANKVVTKNILKENNIKAVNSYIVGFDNDIEPINHNMNYPVIIKPNTTVLNTTSIIAYDKEGFLNGIKKALSFKCDVIVEEYIEGRVFSVGILDKKALPVLEILPLNSRSKDPNVRVNGIKASMCPAKIDNDLENKVKDQALKIANILGLKRYSNITFIVNDDIVCYSCDSLPQLDQYSHMAIMAKAAGISFNDFCEKIVELTLINE